MFEDKPENNLIIATECDEHGVETINAPRVALACPNGAVFAFSFDVESGGILVSIPEGTLSVGILTIDGKTEPKALVLLSSQHSAAQEVAPSRRLN